MDTSIAHTPLSDIRSMLITGGTGTLGQALVAAMVQAQSSCHLRIFSRSEYLQHQMRATFSQANVEFLLGDVRDADRVRTACRGMEAVVHAAALKHVTRGESAPGEFYRTNICGTEHVIQAATEAGVRRVILISSDKSVAPINAYGATKLLAERLALSAASNRLVPCNVVRYGNVLGSRGSVLETYRQALRDGKPLPVTALAMSRFHLTTETALTAIGTALTTSITSAVFIPKLPAYTLADVCRAMLGLPEGAPLIEGKHVQTIGRRPGERTYELLLTPEECRRTIWASPMPGEPAGMYVLLPTEQTTARLTAYNSNTWPQRLSVALLREAIDAVPECTVAHDHR